MNATGLKMGIRRAYSNNRTTGTEYGNLIEDILHELEERSSVNYAEVCDTVKNVLQSEKYNLIETAAIKIIEGVFGKHI